MTTANRVVPDRYGVINIGKLKENLVTEVSLPAPGFSGGSYAVLLKRPKEEQPYPVSARHDGNSLVWTVQTADTAIAGMGKLECRWYGDNGEVAKSETYMVRIKDGLSDPTEAPEAWAGFMQQVSRDAGRAESAADNAVNTLKKLEDGIASGDFRGEKGEQGEKGDPGPQGPQGEPGPAGDTTAADAAAEAAKEAAQEAQKAAEASAGSAAQAAESVGGLADDLEATQKDIAKMKRAIKFQAALNKGQTWDFEEDTQEAYQRTVPSGAKAGAVMEYGGKTVGWNQLQKPRAVTRTGITETVNADGTVNLSGEFTDPNGYGWFPVGKNILFNRINQHIYLGIAPKKFDRSFGVAGYGALSTEGSNLFVWKAPKDTENWPNALCAKAVKGDVIEYSNIRFSVIDLTLLYGTGNEPTNTTDPRIAQIEAYAAAHPEHNAGELLSAQVDEVRVRGKNLLMVTGVTSDDNYPLPYPIPAGATVSASFTGTASADNATALTAYLHSSTGYTAGNSLQFGTIAKGTKRYKASVTTTYVVTLMRLFKDSFWNLFDSVRDFQLEIAAAPTAYSPYRDPVTYPVPSAVQSLPGYGWSAGSVANTVERTENGWQYVQRVGSVDLGTLDWYDGGTGTSARRMVSRQQVGDANKPQTSSTTPNVVCGSYKGVAPDDTWLCTKEGITLNNNDATVIVYDTAYSTAESVAAFESHINGVILYYELATPITTDITAMMGDSLAPFAVEAGGSITLHHPKADEGFAIDVPAEIQYITKLSEVSANG